MIPNEAQTAPQELCHCKIIHLDRVARAKAESPGHRDLDRLTQTFKALGDPTRLKLLIALAGGEMCVCDLAAFLGLSESAVSHHLRRLKDLALLRSRRAGQVLYYSLDDEHVGQLLDLGLTHVRE